LKNEKRDKFATKDKTPKLFEKKESEGGESSSTFSMTQMLGLCSGKFDDSNTSISTTGASPKKTQERDHQSELEYNDDNANNSFSNFTFPQSFNVGDVVNESEAKGSYIVQCYFYLSEMNICFHIILQLNITNICA